MKQRVFHYTAIGDSLTVGYGVPEDHSFPARYRALAEQALGRKVVLHNTGKVGATSSEILQLVQQDPDVRAYVQQADLITVTAGGNDLIQAAKIYFNDMKVETLKKAHLVYAQSMRRLMLELKRLRLNKNRPCIVRLVGIYNPIPEFDEAAFWIKRFNSVIFRLEKDSIRAVQVYDAFDGRLEELLSDDRFHPNSEGYNVLAELTHKLGYGGLAHKASK